VKDQPALKKYTNKNDGTDIWALTEPGIYHQAAYVQALSRFVTDLDDITSATFPTSLASGSGTATVTVNYALTGAGTRHLWVGIFDATGAYKGSSSVSNLSGSSRTVSCTWSGLTAGPATIRAELRSNDWMAVVDAASGMATVGGGGGGGDTSPYHFESDTQEWGNLWNAPQITSVATSTEQASLGSRSLKTAMSNTSGSSKTVNVLVAPPLSSLTAGKTLTVRYRFSNATGVSGCQVFSQTGSAYTWRSAWIGNPTAGSWQSKSLTIPSGDGTVQNLGFQVVLANGASTSLYLDQITW
jgi:hypothetical protein